MKRLALILLAIAILLVGDTVLDPSLPPNIAAVLRDQDRRIRNLENSPNLTNSSIKDGTLAVLDSGGNTMVRLGKVDSSYGIKVTTPTGAVVFEKLASGLTFPRQSLAMTISGNIRPGTTSAAYDELWRADFDSIGPSVNYDLTAFPNAGNMDFVILLYEKTTSPYTAFTVTALTANTQYSGTLTLNSASFIAGTGTDPAGRHMTLRIQAKRNSGASTVDVALNGNFVNYG